MIPIANLYYLLCYAWDVRPPTGLVLTGADVLPPHHHPALPLLAHLLLGSLRQRQRHGVAATYAPVLDRGRVVRGRLVFDALVRAPAPPGSGSMPSRFLALTVDSPVARVFVTALRRLLQMERGALPKAQRAAARALLAPLTAVPALPQPIPADFRAAAQAVPLTDARTHLALRAAELLLRNLLPTTHLPEGAAPYRFHDFTTDEAQMGAIFEAFVRNFLRREQGAATVSAEVLRWRGASAATPAARALLPVMRTDSTLIDATRRLVIDTKYYLRALPTGRFDAPRLIAPHLYQLLAYLRNQPTAPGQVVEGMLLYPVSDHTPPLRLEYQLDGFRVRVRTLDLRAPWSQISQELLGAVANPAMKFPPDLRSL